MKNKNVRGILALVLVTALSFGVIVGSKALSENMGENADQTAQAGDKVLEELAVDGAEHIEKAVKTENGYMVTVRTAGYGGDIVMNVSFDETAETVTKVEVTEQNETENLGARIAEPEFLSQFEGVKAPVWLPGMSLESGEAAKDELEGAALQDGTYEAKTEGPDQSGFTDQVTITVADGRITEVNWDALLEDGTRKSVMSENGEYTMTEDGLTWKEQAEALAAALVENQSLGFLSMNEQGKTDAVSGVSISVGGFINLAEQCLRQAAGVEEAETVPQDGTQADAVSGATISSTAAVKGINQAYDFLQTVK
ncbi:MAG: FMN-binding protein [Clostridiales bacterium]|nr:FMN-binding protein [Clostridiales bacterium]